MPAGRLERRADERIGVFGIDGERLHVGETIPVSTTRRETLAAALELVSGRLQAAGIWHCLIFGTLLGAIRDGDVIEWDHDLDLLARPADVPRIIEACAGDRIVVTPIEVSRSWFALDPGGVAHGSLSSLSLSVDGVGVGELWLPVLFSDGVLRLGDLARSVSIWPQTALPAFVFETLAEAELRGQRYPVPAQAEVLLEWLYGPAWRVPLRAAADGGKDMDGLGRSGDRVTPALAEQIAWCDAQGWDRSVYAAQPVWPRELAAAGPFGSGERAATTSGSDWWRSLEEIGELY